MRVASKNRARGIAEQKGKKVVERIVRREKRS